MFCEMFTTVTSVTVHSYRIFLWWKLLRFILLAAFKYTIEYYYLKNFVLKYTWFTMLYYFRCTAEWYQLYIYIYMYLFSCFFSSWFIIEYWIQFPVLCSRILLFIHSIDKTLHLLVPNSQSNFSPLLSHLGNHKAILYLSDPVSV